MTFVISKFVCDTLNSTEMDPCRAIHRKERVRKSRSHKFQIGLAEGPLYHVEKLDQGSIQ